jgi:hypothetical protein
VDVEVLLLFFYYLLFSIKIDRWALDIYTHPFQIHIHIYNFLIFFRSLNEEVYYAFYCGLHSNKFDRFLFAFTS